MIGNHIQKKDVYRETQNDVIQKTGDYNSNGLRK